MNRRGFLKTGAAGLLVAAPAIVDSKGLYRGYTEVWVPPVEPLNLNSCVSLHVLVNDTHSGGCEVGDYFIHKRDADSKVLYPLMYRYNGSRMLESVNVRTNAVARVLLECERTYGQT